MRGWDKGLETGKKPEEKGCVAGNFRERKEMLKTRRRGERREKGAGAFCFLSSGLRAQQSFNM